VTVRLRPLESGDLALVAGWLAAPHVARWWLPGTSVERELDDLRQIVRGEQPVHALVVMEGDYPIGWCQWYLCRDHPDWAADIGAAPGDAGIDYAIGERTCVGRGLGTALVGALVERLQAAAPVRGVIADPDERNIASRRVLEKNGFALTRVAVLPSEPSDDPVAIYRRRGDTVP
jgi:aminoglycoside 6'-N-acetyltransferase